MLTAQIHGLRVAAEDQDDDENRWVPAGTGESTATSPGWMVGMGSGDSRKYQELSLSMTASRNDHATLSKLCHLYLEQVDPIVKILHRPTLEGFMLQGGNYLGRDRDHPSVEALKAAVCYSAVISMSEAQCQAVFGTNKLMMVGDYRRACEAACERAGLLTTDDMVVLQAFVLYLVS